LTRATGRRTEAQCRGGSAEDEAARLLTRHGLSIVARNYRTRLGEIDLVAMDGEVLVFVEVRLRSSDRYGGAAGSITFAMKRRLERAARHYLSRMGREPPCRFDVVTLGAAEPAWLRAAFDVAPR
jgi:putative endonuclease